MSVPNVILELIERFERNKDSYRSTFYKEAQLREEFINPFFGKSGMGWDVFNEEGYAEAYKEVVHEDAIKIGVFTKAPDYSFRIGGARKFFVEAKKPSSDIKDNPESAYQLRRYAWSAKLPLSILTNFGEFAIYDCRFKPSEKDSPAIGRKLYINYEEYPDRWDEIAEIFSKDAINKGSFDKYAEKKVKGTAEVDAVFLKEIEQWRESLARNIALRNPNLTTRELNFAVQATIDRIIFLRICEDRGIEDPKLAALKNRTNIYALLTEIFEYADQRYNSGLFHFHKEKDRPFPDELTLDLTIDDKPLNEIFKKLYYPESPYEFSVLSADILGQVYEQFLGKVIRLTAGHQAKVEDKPEVKKAGGVYYTPTYIVDYIVKNTVGKLLNSGDAERGTRDEGNDPPLKKGGRGDLKRKMTPKKVSKLKILDPACGSGSFLIGAYQYLLNWHRDYYIADGPQKHKKVLYRGPRSDWRLTTEHKKEILLNNIYGVDIDSQAVEVTKLSLLLKVLEGESQLSIWHERPLPDLGNNIKCGNSLIGPDFYDNQQLSFLDEEERYRINVFDWESEFPEIFQGRVTRDEGHLKGRPTSHVPSPNPGFDAVIGNPPYIRIQNLKEFAPLEVEHYKKAYISASKGNYDIYVVFVEKGLNLLNENGFLGFILPHKFFNAQYGEPLRGLLASGKHISHIVHFGHQQVFVGPTTYTNLLFVSKSESKNIGFRLVNNLRDWIISDSAIDTTISAKELSSDPWNFAVGSGSAVFNKLQKMPIKLGTVARIFQGLVTGADKVFYLEEIAQAENGLVETKDIYGDRWLLEQALLKPFLYDHTVSTFKEPQARYLLIFPYCIEKNKAELISSRILNEQFPRTWAYLTHNAEILRGRERGKWKHENWYAYGRTQNLTQMEGPKLIVQVISRTGQYAYDDKELYFTGGGNGPYYGIRWLDQKEPHSLYYLQAVLSSKLIDWFLHQISSPFRGGYWSYGKRFIEQIPIPDPQSPTPGTHDRIISLVTRMLDLNKQLQSAKTTHDKDVIHRQINSTDKQIDRLVYALYELTLEEIRLVEGEHG